VQIENRLTCAFNKLSCSPVEGEATHC
jgi:hypothetical protein